MDLLAREWAVTELINRCLKRPADEIAWQEFVRRFHPTILASVSDAFQYKARREVLYRPETGEDLISNLVQAVYSRLVENRCHALKQSEIENTESMHKYLAMISINIVRAHFRQSHLPAAQAFAAQV